MMANKKRLIDANAVLETQFTAGLSDASGNYYGHADVVFASDIENAQTVDAVMLSDLEAWLYEIAMRNVGEKFDGDFSDAVEEIINRLDGLRVFAEERRTDG